MQTTCIRHPERQPLIQIKAWQVYATNGNYCAAALLSFLEYWHNYKLDEREKSNQRNNVAERHGEERTYDESLLQFHTEKELSAGLLGLYRETAINDAVKVLVDLGFVTVHRNPNPKFKFDNTKYFLLNVENVQKYIDEDYPEKTTSKGLGLKVLEKFTAKGKKTSRESENTSPQGENTSPQGENTGTITEITSETSTEITSNTWSEASSDEIRENVTVDSGNPEKVEALVLSRKKLSKREMVNKAANDPKSIAFFENLRNKFQLYSGNSYLKSFASHKAQFYKTLSYRVANEEVSQSSIEEAFHEMTLGKDFSIMQFLEKLKSTKYTDTKALIDFIWIMLDGKIAAFVAEKKGAKELSEWIEDGKVTLTEIEDCFLWLPSSGRGYKQSLISLKAALSAFDTVKTLKANGRFSGKSLNSEYKTSSEKSVEILKQRDYNQMASEILEESEAKKLRMAELIAIANGKK